MLGALDRIPRFWRHAAIGVLFLVGVWVADSLVPALSPWLDAHPPLGPLVGALVAQLVLYLGPLLRVALAGWAGDTSAPDTPGRHEDAGEAGAVYLARVAFVGLAILTVYLVAVRSDQADATTPQPAPVQATPPPMPSPLPPAPMPQATEGSSTTVVVFRYRSAA